MSDALHMQRLKLPTSPGSNGTRQGEPNYLTVHYNGPSVAGAGNPDAELKQLRADAQYHIDKVWGYTDAGVAVHGHRIMYDFAVLSDGAIFDLGNRHDLLFHCGNELGNNNLAVHLPLGGAQDATDKQFAGLIRLYEALGQQYGWSSRGRLIGHCEWPRGTSGRPIISSDVYRVQHGQSLCPGAHIMARVIAYRNRASLPPRLTYRVRNDIDYANVRTAPTTESMVAVLAGRPYRLLPGEEVLADAVIVGQAVGTESRWLHLANQLGFVSRTVVQ